MKAIKFLSLIAMAMLLTVNARSQTVIDEVRGFYKNGLDEFNSGNYDAYLARIHDDFKGYAGVHSPFLFDGKQEWVDFINGMKGLAAANYHQRDVNFTSYGNTTVVRHAYFTFTTVTKTGEIDVQNGRETAVLVKDGTTWKIANLHFSAMF